MTLAALSAVLAILAFPNFNQAWAAWIALVPLSLISRRSSPRQAFLWGWLSGTLAYSGILCWIIVTFRAAHLSIFLACFCLLLLAGYLGLYWGVWTWFLSRAHSGAPLQFPLIGAAAWVALEYARTYLFSGFPWALLADSQVKMLPLIQIASITGVYGVSFLIVWFNLAVATWRPKSLVLPLMAIVLACQFGHYRLHRSITPLPSRLIKVALLQGNIDQYKKWDKAYVEEIQKTYERLIAEATAAKPDIILWPETSVPGYLLQDPPLRNWLQKIVRNSHTSHLVGAPTIHDNNAYNSAFSLTHEGYLSGEYAKQHLVPFGEIVPWASVLGRCIRVLNDLGGFTSGKGSPVLNVAGIPVGINICYEAIFPNLVRQSVKEGAVLIANLTNDGWYMRTAAPYEHWAPNILRAVENDRWVVRADNTGISGIIDPCGRVQVASRIFEPAVIVGTAAGRTGLTFYTRFGDCFAWACVTVVFALLIYSRL